MVIGARCTKDTIYMSVLEGNKENPIVKSKERLKIILTVPKSADSRCEELYYIHKDIQQVIDKYNPKIMALKDYENTPHRINPKSNAQRGELEGLIKLICYNRGINLETLMYTQTKTRLSLTDKKKEFQYNEVKNKFSINSNNDRLLDAILVGWAVL